MEDKLKLFISEKDILERIEVLAQEINRDYQDEVPIFIGVLNGAFMFLSDLLKCIKVDCEVDFLKLSSYGDGKISSGNVKLLKNFDCDIEGRHIIIVEDIVDTGLSIAYIRDMVSKYNPKSMRCASLLHKKAISKIDFPIDYVAFEIGNDFVVGYGLDYAQKYRNLKEIYVL